MKNVQLDQIYEGVDYSGIKIEFQEFSENKPLCVFGILNNDLGKNIAKEMLSWLTETYNVICVYQEPPGKLYEYPALRAAQYFVSNSDKYEYCLYIHTKGAGNPNCIQRTIRNMWKTEFGKERYKLYVDVVSNENEPIVALPISGPDRQTWYNGFFANKKAWNDLDIIKPKDSRYWFECMWRNYKNTKIIGIIKDKIDPYSLGSILNKY